MVLVLGRACVRPADCYIGYHGKLDKHSQPTPPEESCSKDGLARFADMDARVLRPQANANLAGSSLNLLQ